ncbi:hypothetical protein PQG02_00280 (plasmid) [Nostoc sp. UHCC 0926]|uniref:hypothetical protein n=1 Tax=Nostoc sp. UHCC 0926 TaxID=3025190 RepID=UPI0023620AFC|nr:hypothetical protein [Nostoc sp. UHCC 0926]WDD30124.1 hypothetical protein PQG02_00280 [Nostoc sp. UHCC 0926]
MSNTNDKDYHTEAVISLWKAVAEAAKYVEKVITSEDYVVDNSKLEAATKLLEIAFKPKGTL